MTGHPHSRQLAQTTVETLKRAGHIVVAPGATEQVLRDLVELIDPVLAVILPKVNRSPIMGEVSSTFGDEATDEAVEELVASMREALLDSDGVEDVFAEDRVIERSIFRTLAEALPVVTTTPESRAALEEWLVSFIEAYAHYGPLIRSWTEAERAAEGAEGAGDDVLATVAAALTAKVKVRTRKDLDPAIASLALVAMVERVNYFLATGQLTDDATAVARTLAGIVLDALFGPGRHG